MTGKTPQPERERIYDRFRRGDLHCIVLSKVGNFAIDLPDADVLIQVSGAFGSRQEEAQRLGRILRPKRDGRAAHFFTLVSRDTREEEFAHHRKLFLTEQVTRTTWCSSMGGEARKERFHETGVRVFPTSTYQTTKAALVKEAGLGSLDGQLSA